MKLYKFYKNGCAPCYVLSRMLMTINIPKDIEIVGVNVELEENKNFAKENDIDRVPVLMLETGEKLVGVTNKDILIYFISQGENKE